MAVKLDMGRVTAKDSLFSNYVRITLVIACYWIVSISLVFVNKYLLSGQDVKLDAPLFVTCFQCVVTVILCLLMRYMTNMFPSYFSFPPLDIDKQILLKVLPLSAVFVAMIAFNNLCLKHVGVSFYYIGRSLTTVFNVILTYVFLKQKTSFKAILCCFLIVFGFGLGVDQEGVAGSLSIRGVIYGVLASLFVSLYSIFVKKVLPVVEESIWLLTYYNNINAVLLFIPLIIVFGEVQEVIHFQNVNHGHFWLLMSMGGVFGFAIGYVTGLQIKVTSPLTHNISGTAKACAQTVFAVSWFQESKSVLWWVSNSIVLIGSAAYTRVRQVEMVQTYNEHKQKQLEDIEQQKS